MKKLLSPALNRWFCYTLVLLCSAMYAQPCTFNDVIERTIYSSYKKYNADLDMLAVLNYKKTDFYGFIGVNRKRLRITFTSIKKSEENKDVYEVEGFSTVMNKNKRTFKGTFKLLSHYRLTAPAFDGDEPLKKGEAEGFSTFSYTLKEDENLTATGVFKGEMLVLWYKGINKKPVYTELFIQSDGSRNYQFFGRIHTPSRRVIYHSSAYLSKLRRPFFRNRCSC